MKKILNLITVMVISTSSASSVVSCGTPAGPSIPTTLYNANSNPDYAKSMDVYDYKKNGHFDGILKNIALPMLTIMNQDPAQNKNDEKENKSHFSDSVLKKSSLLSDYNKKRLQADFPDAKEFYKIYDSSYNSFYTHININTKANQSPEGIVSFDKVPYYKDISNTSNYTDKDNPSMSKWKTDKNNLWADSRVLEALKYLNNKDQNVSYSKTATTNKLPKDQPYTHALLQLNQLSFTSVLTYGSEKFEVDSTLKNIVANIDFKYTQIGKEKKYIWSWLLDGYDYYNQDSINKTKAIRADKAKKSIPDTFLYLNVKDTFPTRSVMKHTKDANFPDVDLTITRIKKL